jgi:hypothetical protein
MRQCQVSPFHGRAQSVSSLRVSADAKGMLAGVLTGCFVQGFEDAHLL